MDVRIGVTQAREVEVELPEDTDPEALQKTIDEALSSDDRVLWLTDRRGRRVAVPSSKVAYVEIGSPSDSRRIGFGA
ncbi:DUF3107 domain-containing protein [Actinomarinicola tropica]|uniref:DUF3107 family protein n=1 Tax=Actinomarinicola tropica TaxID=2789776 RepID=A0A5Q2RMX2_9ACTN|nr:DUF3107 domain-containing protein [Actinomarinicola tropica]QGG94545.1 DUF3107 family protein [Actinomarinicola tropica]